MSFSLPSRSSGPLPSATFAGWNPETKQQSLWVTAGAGGQNSSGPAGAIQFSDGDGKFQGTANAVLNATGDINVRDVIAGSLTTAGFVAATGAIIGGLVASTGNMNVAGSLDVTGDIVVTGDVGVTGATALSGGISGGVVIDGDVEITTNLVMSGDPGVGNNGGITTGGTVQTGPLRIIVPNQQSTLFMRDSNLNGWKISVNTSGQLVISPS